MSFLSIFRSQMPNIVDKLRNIRFDLDVTQANIERLLLLERELFAKEEALRMREHRIETAIAGFGLALWLKDLQGRFVYVNKACCKTILKCTEKEALGLRNGDLKKDALAQVCMKTDKEIIEHKTTKRWIENAVYEDGHSVFIDTMKSPVYEDNQLIGVVGSALDISDQVPANIKINRMPASIEISTNQTMSSRQLIEILERRKELRS